MAKRRKRKRKVSCRRVKSGPRKGRCRLKKSAARKGKRRSKNFCVRARGAKCAVACFSSAKAALKFANKSGGVAGKRLRTCKTLSKKGKRVARRGGSRFTTLSKQMGR